MKIKVLIPLLVILVGIFVTGCDRCETSNRLTREGLFFRLRTNSGQLLTDQDSIIFHAPKGLEDTTLHFSESDNAFSFEFYKGKGDEPVSNTLHFEIGYFKDTLHLNKLTLELVSEPQKCNYSLLRNLTVVLNDSTIYSGQNNTYNSFLTLNSK